MHQVASASYSQLDRPAEIRCSAHGWPEVSTIREPTQLGKTNGTLRQGKAARQAYSHSVSVASRYTLFVGNRPTATSRWLSASQYAAASYQNQRYRHVGSLDSMEPHWKKSTSRAVKYSQCELHTLVFMLAWVGLLRKRTVD